MGHRHEQGRDRSKTRLRFAVGNQPFGIYTWYRDGKGGIIFRFGPVGHLQFQQYRCKLVGKPHEHRRGAHGLGVYWWGVAGRRRKRGINLEVYL